MQAIVQSEYGKAQDVMTLAEVPVPRVGSDQVLIRVHRGLVTRAEQAFQSGTKLDARLFAGLRRPRMTTLGMAVVGRIEAIGDAVTDYAVGDRVITGLEAAGGHAEYVLAGPKDLVHVVEEDLDDVTLLAVLEAQTAYHFLAEVAGVKPGQEVLINGASGGVGSTGVQIAKHLGARVTAVCSGRNEQLVRGLGADAVIDYTEGPFTDTHRRFDVLFDAIGGSSFSESRHLLRAGGRYLTTVLSFTAVLWAGLSRLWGGERCTIAFAGLNQTPAQYEQLIEMARLGELTATVDRHVSLCGVPEAYDYVATGRKRGLVVVDVNPEYRGLRLAQGA